MKWCYNCIHNEVCVILRALAKADLYGKIIKQKGEMAAICSKYFDKYETNAKLNPKFKKKSMN